MTSKTLSDVAQRLTVSPSSRNKIRSFVLVLVLFASIPALSLAGGIDNGSATAEHGNLSNSQLPVQDGDESAAAYSSSEDGTLRAINSSGGEIWSDSHSEIIETSAPSAEGDVVYSGGRDNAIRAVHAQNGSEIWSSSVHSDWVLSLMPSPDGETVYSAGRDSTVKATDSETGDVIWTYNGYSEIVWSIATDGDVVYAGGDEDDTDPIRALDAETGEELWNSSASTDRIYGVAPVGNTLYVASNDGTVKALDANTGTQIWSSSVHSGSVRSVASTDGDVIYTASGDQTVKALDAENGEEIWSFDGHTSTVYSVASSQDGSVVYSGSGDDTVKAINANTGEEIWEFDGHTASITDVSTTGLHGSLADPITGQVVDQNGEPLDNVSVEFSQEDTIVGSDITGENGQFGVSVENGTYDIEFSKPQYQPLSVTRTVTEGQNIGTFELLPRRLELDVPSRIDPEETAGYTVTFDGDDVTANATVTSGNETLLTVNNETHTINATEEIGIATVTASYNASDGETYNITEEVVVAPVDIEYLEILPGVWRFTAFFDSMAVQVILIAMCAAIIGTRASSAFGGLGAAQLTLTIGWFGGWISTGVMLVGLFTAMFIGLNLAANIDYTIRR